MQLFRKSLQDKCPQTVISKHSESGHLIITQLPMFFTSSVMRQLAQPALPLLPVGKGKLCL